MPNSILNRVAVVIPVCDRPQLVIKSINSVLLQTYTDVQVVIVENNSKQPDEVRSAVESIDDPRVKYFSLERCSNANVARNYGVKVSEAEYIAFLDSDDEYLPCHIEDTMHELQETKADFVYGPIQVWDGEGFRIDYARQIGSNESPVDYLFGNQRGSASTCTYLIKKSCFDTISWDENLHRHQDFDFFIQAASRFRSVCKKAPTVNVNWIKGEKRSYDRKSFICFYSKWKHAMAPSVRARYLYGKSKLAIKHKDIKLAIGLIRTSL